MVNTQPLVSIIIIDYKINNPYLIECLEAIGKQTYKNYEILLLTDYPNQLKFPKLIKKSYGQYISPARKRDDGAKMAKGEILAFIDDDAFPEENWLKYVLQSFKEPKIVAVGGPGITPPNVSWQEVASGWMSASPLGAGPYSYRFLPGKKQYVDDYPSMNLAVRRIDFLKVGGFDSHYWPGEDTKLCLDLVYKLNKKILYEPKAVVYHHRRPLWTPHLSQNGNFGLHRGYFARILPKTSLKPIYVGPPLMVLGLTFMLASSVFANPLLIMIRSLGIYLFTGYLILLILNGLWVFNKSKSVLQGFIVIPAVFITHLWYGLRFLQGYLFTKNLKR